MNENEIKQNEQENNMLIRQGLILLKDKIINTKKLATIEQETKGGEWEDLINYYQVTTTRTENLINEYNVKVLAMLGD